MATFVLIHGAWHGAWCWYKLIPELRRRGHAVIAPDLPGHGRDRTIARMPSFGDYVGRVVGVVQACTEPVVLVGHSMAGGIITAVGEAIPEHIARLIFLCAAVVRNGESLSDITAGDDDSMLGRYVSISRDGLSLALDPQGLRPLFYGDCSDEDVSLAGLLLTPQAVQPTLEPVVTTQGSFGRLPKSYIACSRDAAIGHAKQRSLIGTGEWDGVVTLDTSHSPFLSRPVALADSLATLSKS